MARLTRRLLIALPMAATLSLVLITAPAADAATGSGTATGTSQALGHFVHFPPPCALTQSLTFAATGTGTYTATRGGQTATYTGPVQLTLQKTAPPGYTGPFGTHGYSPTCANPAGTPFQASATTNGTVGSDSVSCTYTGTLSRVNPKLGNGTDLATAVLTGTCTVRQDNVVVSDSPTQEMRTITYILDSCTGGPAPNFACRNNTTFAAVDALAITTTSLPLASLGSSYSAMLAATGGSPPYTFALTSGSLPTGLSLGPSGAITGTPVVPGTSNFTVKVTDSGNPATVATQALSITVGGCTNTVNRTHNGPLIVRGGITCVTGTTVNGPVVVFPGAVVALTNAHVNGPLVSRGAKSVAVCGSTIRGPVTVSGSSGFVLIGDNGDDGSPACGANTISGSVVLNANRAGLELGGNTISGSVSLARNTGAGPDPENAATEVEANHIGGVRVGR